MRLMSYADAGDARIGVETGDGVVDLRAAVAAHLADRGSADPAGEAAWRVPSDMVLFLTRAANDFELFRDAAAATTAPTAMDPAGIERLAPVPRPGKVIGVGRNYGAHAAEGALGRQEEPRLFTKFSSSVVASGVPVACPAGIVKFDWEVEIAIVVGKPMKHVPPADALSYVAGYTVLNDLSAREFQFDVSPPQTTFAKSHDGFTPMGPVMVTADAFGDPGHVDLTCHVNGVEMQRGNTHDMIFDCAYILSYISRYATLEPGDVIATGTPSGVGHFRDPPVYLKAGDRVTCWVDGIGAIENPII
ncbi:MAG: fumarylacetoacetate hydrolase family protein [Thalassobaculaceae bacterium]|nr:fumarylacetoacetate hydrolase family protein [Thalassobaculaceae bacterium]